MLNKKRTYQVVVLGSGESGVGAAILAKKQGFGVFVSDYNSIDKKFKTQLINYEIDFEENQHTNDVVLSAQEIIKSPGIPEKAPIMKAIRTKGIKVVSEIEFASRYTDAKIIAITGSNGKTTTTELTYSILSEAGIDVTVCGNIGNSFAYEVATNDKPYYVLEVSSFQLDDIESFKPHIAILTNITPDHLDRYEYKLENYAASKFNIVKNQTEEDYFIYCLDDELSNQYLDQFQIKAQKIPFSIEKQLDKGGFIENDNLTIQLKKKPQLCQLTA